MQGPTFPKVWVKLMPGSPSARHQHPQIISCTAGILIKSINCLNTIFLYPTSKAVLTLVPQHYWRVGGLGSSPGEWFHCVSSKTQFVFLLDSEATRDHLPPFRWSLNYISLIKPVTYPYYMILWCLFLLTLPHKFIIRHDIFTW